MMRWLERVLHPVFGDRDGQSGQAAVEYAMSTVVLVTAGLVALPVVQRFAPDMLNALQIYVDGFYFSLALPFP